MTYRDIEFNTVGRNWFFLSDSPCDYTWEQLVKRTEAAILHNPEVDYNDKVEIMKSVIDRAHRYGITDQSGC